MANLIAGGLKSLAQHQDIAGANNDKIVQTWQEVQSWKTRSWAEAHCVDVPPGSVTYGDLNLMPATQHSTGKHFVEIVLGFTDDVNNELKATLKDKMEKNDYDNLPSMFSPAAHTEGYGYTMSLVVSKHTDGQNIAIKYYKFITRMTGRTFQSKFLTANGTMYQPHIAANTFASVRTLDRLLEKMGGFNCRYVQWPHEFPTKQDVTKDVSNLKRGFKFIADKAKELKLTDIDNRIVTFTEIQVNTPESPIFGWSPALVASSFRNHAKSAEAAKTITDFKMTLQDVKPWFMDRVLVQILGIWLSSTFMFLGRRGIGKSPIAKILAMLFSLWHIKDNNLDTEPSFRTTSDFEHMKYEPGRVERSEVYDDGPLQKQPAERVKAFQDNTEEETRTVQRYTGCVWPGNQGRITNNNPFNEKEEPDASSSALRNEVAFGTFLKMILPSFSPDMDLEDLKAVLKRASVVLCTNIRVYFWKACEDESPVPFVEYPKSARGQPERCLLTQAGETQHKKLRKGERTQPEGYQSAMEWSLSWLEELMQGRTPPASATVCGPSSSSAGSSGATVALRPVLVPDPTMVQDMVVKIKREQSSSVGRGRSGCPPCFEQIKGQI